MPTDTHLPTQDAAIDELLEPELLSALMRSTWTWDDRALRRDLSTLLVMHSAAQHCATEPLSAALGAGARSYAARFVASVLGPKLIADTGNPLREAFLPLAGDPASFSRAEHTARRDVAASATEYFSTHLGDVDYAESDSWADLVAAKGVEGLGIAMRSYGHRLSGSTLFASESLAWQAVSLVPKDPRAAEYAQRLQAGDLLGTLAAAEQTGSWDPALVRTRAELSDDGWRLSGVKNYVPSADAADVVFAIGRSTAGPSLFAVAVGAAGMSVTAHPVLDESRPLFEVTLNETPATLIGVEGGGGRLMSRLLDRATTALAAEQVGLVEAAIALLLRTSGAGEGRKSELALDHAAAYSLWRNALADKEPGAAAAAHIGCSAAAVRAATTVADVCGGDEAGAILRRAMSGSLLFGGPALSHERLLERLGI